MKDLDTAAQTRLKELAEEGLKLDERFKLIPWMNVLPIWKRIAKQPLLFSFVAGIALLVLVLLTNLNQLDVMFLVKNILLASGVSVGFYSAYYFCDRSDDIYNHLSQITLLPKDTFHRWFILRASVVWGKVNLSPVNARKQFRFKELLKNDKKIMLWYLASHIVLYPMFVTVLKLPKFTVTPSCISLYLIAFFWCYAWFWTIHWVIYGIIFLVKLSRLPVRYFFGIPNGMTVKEIGNIVVRINYAPTIHFLLLLSILYSWGEIPYEVESMMVENPLMVIFIILGLTIYVAWGVVMGPVVSQIALSRSMMAYAKRSLAKYSYYMEEKYNIFMEQPTEQNYNSLLETKKYMKLLKKMPTFGMTWSYFLRILFIFLLDIGALILYLKLSFQSWSNLREYFVIIISG